MKIEISNLGVVEKAEIDLKPLTVFIGANGTGKTWAAYTLSAILGPYGCENYVKAYIEGKTQVKYPLIDHAIQQLFDEGNAQINLIQFANDFGEVYINDVASFAPNWMQSFMATERVVFDKLQLNLSLEETKVEFLARIQAAFVDLKTARLLRAVKESGEEIIYFYSEGEIKDKLPNRAVKEFVVVGIFHTLHQAIFAENLYIFPTERNTYIGFPLAPPNFSEKQFSSEAAFEEDISLASEVSKTGLMEPGKNLLQMLFMAALKKLPDRELEIKNNPQIADYVKLADLLEKDILQGNVNFESSDWRKDLLFQPTENTKLEMSIASSMVKELAPLVLCLRSLVKPNEWLIIDEPEMNLHPAAQVEIIEFLAMLVNAGLKVLITTHSPYIVDHLANLMQAAKHQDQESIKELFYLERTESFIPQEKVSVYLFEEGTAKNIVNEEGIINWETFGKVSNDVSRIYSELISRENQG